MLYMYNTVIFFTEHYYFVKNTLRRETELQELNVTRGMYVFGKDVEAVYIWAASASTSHM